MLTTPEPSLPGHAPAGGPERRDAAAHAFAGPVALVLCGGGSYGALEVGFARALFESGLKADMILGSSIGALNGAFLAGGMSLDALAALWRGFRLRTAVRPNFGWIAHPRRRPGFLSLSPLRRILRNTLPVTRFEDLQIPLTIVTTDLTTGCAHYWEGPGDIVEPLIASMSLPGIFPPVVLDAALHIDGGIADNVPLGRAKMLGARTALMIECACASPCGKPPSGWSGIVGRSFEIALSRKHLLELEVYGVDMDILRIFPKLEGEPSLLSFANAQQMFDVAYAQTMACLRERGGPSAPMPSRERPGRIPAAAAQGRLA